MILKDSAEKTSTIKPIGDDLNYTFDYEYDSEKYAHRLLRAGDRHYKYDANGNIDLEHDGKIRTRETADGATKSTRKPTTSTPPTTAGDFSATPRTAWQRTRSTGATTPGTKRTS